MAKVLLGVTGSVAAMRTPELCAALQKAGHHVKVVATQAGRYFFDPLALPPPTAGADKVFFVDEDEWPGRGEGRRYQRDDPVLHIELRRWADLLLIAPLDANTLAKLANGLCDNCLTCVWRAWDPDRPVVLAPAMNTLMWENPLSRRHLRQLVHVLPSPLRGSAVGDGDGGEGIPEDLDQDGIVARINQAPRKLRVVPPISKRLACGDVGVGAMAAVEEIVKALATLLD